MLGFNGAELRLARTYNSLSLEDVAEQVGKTRQYIHKLETGQAIPSMEMVEALAKIVRVTPAFLESQYEGFIIEEQFHFRKQFTTRMLSKQVIMARGEIVGRLIKNLEGMLDLPPVRIPEINDPSTSDAIERAADRCRMEWGLGMGPIANMHRLSENIGVIIASAPTVGKEIDALSVGASRPFIFINDVKESVCRRRFDIGHELGHFVFHAGIVTGDRITESQANRFSSALLVPRSMMAKLFPRNRGTRLDWKGISEFKTTWKVSKAALLYRAKQLDLISEDQYRSGFITLKRTGEAVQEKEDHLIPSEGPELLQNSLKLLASGRKVGLSELAQSLKVSPDFLKDIMGFDPPVVEDVISAASLEKTVCSPVLRIVS